jgi:hypothetical protein
MKSKFIYLNTDNKNLLKVTKSRFPFKKRFTDLEFGNIFFQARRSPINTAANSVFLLASGLSKVSRGPYSRCTIPKVKIQLTHFEEYNLFNLEFGLLISASWLPNCL